MEEKTWIIELCEDEETGELMLPFPKDLLDAQGWKPGVTIEWVDNKDGSWTLKKKEELQWVLVETISQFRQRYMVQAPVGIDAMGNDKAEWALDAVALEKARGFANDHLGETIISHRVVTEEEALEMCDRENDYAKSWEPKLKLSTFFTKVEDYNDDYASTV